MVQEGLKCLRVGKSMVDYIPGIRGTQKLKVAYVYRCNRPEYTPGRIISGVKAA